MKIDLKTEVKGDHRGKNTVTLIDLIEAALFKYQGGEDVRGLYNRIHGKDQVDLKVDELALIQKACNIYVAGVKWQIDDIFNQKNKNHD